MNWATHITTYAVILVVVVLIAAIEKTNEVDRSAKAFDLGIVFVFLFLCFETIYWLIVI